MPEEKRPLLSAEEVQSFVDSYIERFDNQADVASYVPILDHYENCASSLSEAVLEEDTGVEIERQLTPQQLCASLGFTGNSSPLFNSKRRLDGLNVWSNPEAFDLNNVDNLSNLVDLELFWHQLAGAHATIRHCLTKDPVPSHCAGVLICDEVGLGKTYMSATIIAFFIDVFIRQQTTADCKVLPAIFGK